MNNRQLEFGIILSYIGMAIQMIVSLVYTPIMIKYLGQSEYGLYTLVASIVNYLNLCSLGFGSSYMRFYSREKAKGDENAIGKLNGIYLLLFSLFSIIAIVLGFVLVANYKSVLGNNLTRRELEIGKKLLSILVLNVAISFLISALNSIISAKECFIFQRIVTLCSILVHPLLALPLLIIGFGSVGIVLVSTAVNIVALCVSGFYCIFILQTKFIFYDLKFDVVREMGIFSFFLFLNQIIDQINWNLDKYILGRVSGTIAVAIYGIGAQFNNLYLNFSTSIATVFVPKINRMIADGEENGKIISMFVAVGRIQMLVLGLILSGFVLFGRQFIELWAGKTYISAYYVALILMVPVTIPLIQNIGIEIQRAKNRHQFRSLIYLVMAIINGVMSIPLSSKFGVIGAACGTAFSLIIGNGIIMNWYYYKQIQLDILCFWKNIFNIIITIGITMILGFFSFHIFAGSPSWVGFIISIMIYSILYIGIMWIWTMNRTEKKLILSILNRVKGKNI